MTHPETVAVLSVGKEHYKAPADLRRWVALRDGTCRFPGCTRPASRSDLDHTLAREHGGPTDYDNLAHLCRAHHRLKPPWLPLPNDRQHRPGHRRTTGLKIHRPSSAPPTVSEDAQQRALANSAILFVNLVAALQHGDMTSNGTPPSIPRLPHPQTHDVVIIGGGAAGLSAAVVLGRARRSVVVVDNGHPRNAPAEGVHSFLTRDGLRPAELVRLGQDEARSYGVEFVMGRAVDSRRSAQGFTVTLDDGSTVSGHRLLVATGLVDELPDVPGLAERWGRDVLHCPYCHGWEVRDQTIGILGTGPKSVHQALLFRQWSRNITLFLHGDMLDADGTISELHGPTDAEWEQLAARGVSVVIGPVAGLDVRNKALAGVRLASGRLFPLQALVVAPTFTARTDFLAGLGLASTLHPFGVGTQLDSDETGRVLNDGAVVPGVWAAGNATNLMAQVVVSAAAGLGVATMINSDLIAAEVETAVTAYRSPFSTANESRNSDSVLGDRRHGVHPEHTPAREGQSR
ncbi:FAD-dependent oxidoreductase [Cryobacterium sp. TMB3-15]|uniref:FAD-dependent oxidoreductase n=1 Tax=unclassified Cryobacterium TaxID=2649013 RepID=UPI0035142B2E